MFEKKWQRVVFALVMILALSLGGVVQANNGQGNANGRNKDDGPSGPYIEYWDGRGTDSEKCELVGERGRPEEGWIHWVFSTKGQSTDAELVLKIDGEVVYTAEPGEPLNANVWHFYTPYFDLETLEAKIILDGKPGPGGGLVISDYCPGVVPPPVEPKEELTVTKTVETSFVREHKWNIYKEVVANDLLCTTHALVHLYPDGSGDELVKWIIDVEYKGYVDRDMKIYGEIMIKNTGQVDAVITGVEDWLASMPIDVDCPVEFPYTLPVGETLVCTYKVYVDTMIEGYNEVKVTTERDTYTAKAPIIWGEPAEELYKTINVMDESFLRFPDVEYREFGPITAESARFVYEEMVTWAEFSYLEPGHYYRHNRAWIVETGQEVISNLVLHIVAE